ncbi:unknown [Psittacid alphaherpesvirus 1]|uniref:Uncharacterized protein UL3 n=1 Tax=Psittacid herpesvirus 1 (isolate Amazon parrot/-/97-0001/1997) TaxID=670426 RepID=UL03_PSHV1|nr:RecName: Full=Uncharacterized protein UL3 [Psittacid herpesvirus 1 Amazon parrot/1997]AAQ73743.1 unknown [Psittacid alphaherpesvirus 1]
MPRQLLAHVCQVVPGNEHRAVRYEFVEKHGHAGPGLAVLRLRKVLPRFTRRDDIPQPSANLRRVPALAKQKHLQALLRLMRPGESRGLRAGHRHPIQRCVQVLAYVVRELAPAELAKRENHEHVIEPARVWRLVLLLPARTYVRAVRASLPQRVPASHIWHEAFVTEIYRGCLDTLRVGQTGEAQHIGDRWYFRIHKHSR